VDAGVYIGVIGRIPKVVLKEPKKRITDYVVVLVVDPARGHHVTQINFVPLQRGFQTWAAAVIGYYAVTLSHGTGHPGKLCGLH
jgi:hypothetical protein